MSETVNCLSCSRSLRVPDDLLGRNVKCPACGNTFVAEASGGVSPPTEKREAEPDARERDRPAERRSERVAARDEEDRPRRPLARRDEEDEDRPRKRVSRRDDEEDEDRPRRSRRRGAPHRGGMILALGIISLFMMPLVLGPIAWIMGNGDLREMRAGRMDREGESQTNTGRILGMVSTILGIVGLVIGCLVFVFVFGMFGLVAGGVQQQQKRQQPPPPMVAPRRF